MACALLAHFYTCVASTTSRTILILAALSAAMWAQNAENPAAAPQNATENFAQQNGTQTYDRSLQIDRKKTADGEIEVQRYRAQRWQGDDSIAWEREVRTRTLPDGTVEKETVLRNPNGANELEPVQIVREYVKKEADMTTSRREVLQSTYDGWRPVERATVRTSKVADNMEQSVEELQTPNIAGQWQVVQRRTTSNRWTEQGTASHSILQLPDSSGQLADYELRDEHVAKQDGKGAREFTVHRRDRSDTENRRFILVEHTTESSETSRGQTLRHTTTESDLLGGVIPNSYGHNEVVEQCTRTENPTANSGKEIVSNCTQRQPADPMTLHPVPTVVQQVDGNGYVRQIFLPQ